MTEKPLELVLIWIQYIISNDKETNLELELNWSYDFPNIYLFEMINKITTELNLKETELEKSWKITLMDIYEDKEYHKKINFSSEENINKEIQNRIKENIDNNLKFKIIKTTSKKNNINFYYILKEDSFKEQYWNEAEDFFSSFTK